MSSKIKDVVIIGGGPAGITFANQYKKLKPEAEIVMYRPEAHSMVYCAIPYAIEGLFDPSKVFKRDEIVTDSGIELMRKSVKHVDLEQKQITDEDGGTLEYRQLFIATGASPFRPRIPGIDAKNVFTVKTEEDMYGIIERIKTGTRKAVVVGAGAIGIEQAQAYRARGIETWLIDIASHVLPNMIDRNIADTLQVTLNDLGIRTLLETRVESMNTVKEGVCAVNLSRGEFIELDPVTDFVCFAVGMKPDLDLFETLALDRTADGLVVDSCMRTSYPGVFAAGDCCSYISAIDRKPIGGKLATAAVPMAKVAARVAAGKPDDYTGFYNGAATCVGDWKIGSTGFTSEIALKRGIDVIAGSGEMTTLFPMMPGTGPLKVRIIAEKSSRRIVGGQILSKLPATDKTDLITLAIQQEMTVEDLSRLAYSAQPWQSFMPARNAIVMACENIPE
ncbi:FAD-dependent oxidoreductase [bacterium]|nr:FAD-dependent oxidoreductase [candidate division CSSED10-310 bacterium]